MNEILRRAMLHAHIDEVDVAACLEVDPKTVRRWLEGRIPYTRHRWALAELLKLEEIDLWPELRASPSRPNELLAVYPSRSAIAPETWRNFFASAKSEISILDYSGLFLAEDTATTRIFAERANKGANVRIALSDPDSPHITQCSSQEILNDTVAREIRDALILYQSLRQASEIEIRLHRVIPYNSIYQADDEIFVAQHMYGIPAAYSSVLHLRRSYSADMASAYLESFNRIWHDAHLI